MSDFNLDDVKDIIEDFFGYLDNEDFAFFGVTETPPTNEVSLRAWKDNHQINIKSKLRQTLEYIEYLQTGEPKEAKKWEGAWRGAMTRGIIVPYHYMVASMVGCRFNQPPKERRLVSEIVASPYLNVYVESVDLETLEVTWRNPNKELENKEEEIECKRKGFSIFSSLFHGRNSDKK